MNIHSGIFIFTVFITIYPARAICQPEEDAIEISLLTCSSLDAMYASFGHSAVRVTNHATGDDIVFDYGVFRFSDPGFIRKFLKGDLMYRVAPRHYEGFVRSNERRGRGFYEEKLILTADQEQALTGFLMENIKPENMYYKYDFLMDNCATRIRDLFDGEDFQHPDTMTGISFRDNLDYYLGQRKWVQFGTDLLLGATVDREMTFEEKMFLPVYLSEHLNRTINHKTGRPLIEGSEVLLTAADQGKEKRFDFFQPVIVFSLVFILALVVLLTRNVVIRKISPFMYALIGLTGLLIAFMWFGTNHNPTKLNWNLLWLNPFYLVLIISRRNLFNRILVIALSLLAVVVLAGWWLIPQEFNFAVIPIVGILLVFNWNRAVSLKMIPLKSK